MALSIALNNVFCGDLSSSITAPSCFSGVHGIGGVITPLLATAMVSNNIYMLLATWAFTAYDENAVMLWSLNVQPQPIQPYNQQGRHQQPFPRSENRRLQSHQPPRRPLYLRVLVCRSLHSGWVVSFLINYRHGGSNSAGYVSAGSGPEPRSVGFTVYRTHLVGGGACRFLMISTPWAASSSPGWF
ncbi:hypothetical protein BDW66DRAFT_135471 [Aspergillus desertorum]